MSLDTTRLLNNARTHLPGALDATMQLELFNVLNDLFQGSNVWKETIPVTALTGVATYTIVPTGVASIVRLISLVNSSDKDVPATMETPGKLVLDPIPSNDDTLQATVALTVNDPTGGDGFPEFPAWVLNKYSTGILDGLLGRMMAQPAKPYTNEKMALYRTKSFNSVVSQVRTEALHASLNNGQTWRFPQTFARRRVR